MLKALLIPTLCLMHATPDSTAAITSEYTDVEKCPRPAEADESEGGDVPLRCPGPGGDYELTEDYSAYDIHRRITSKSDPSFVVELRPMVKCPVTRFGSKLEWRMKEGKPFAVIQRVTCFALNKEQSGPGKKLGEHLVVKGLKGFPRVDSEVNTKAKDANEKARSIADGAFRER
ncbi:hypothetical protein [Corallococcus carmarthensis]|uniref:Uncharacterized protein n=1 Tax=Corallococcus carmarthensis TaxID=2316728 RepID=A0A3A8JRI0_9BACT|nr:hypothetical protein [Corallococcus carmarthensis]NOK19823.1 hypothetical protein [Corallococcus carmarthensis]RKG98422.1 hypothetical protein D7X32_29680 [Corallococcus carmarthensis]